MLGKIKELPEELDGHADRRGLERAVLGGDKEHGPVVVKEEENRVGDGKNNRKGVLFPPPDQGFHFVRLLGYKKR